jgi:hypothetical protein
MRYSLFVVSLSASISPSSLLLHTHLYSTHTSSDTSFLFFSSLLHFFLPFITFFHNIFCYDTSSDALVLRYYYIAANDSTYNSLYYGFFEDISQLESESVPIRLAAGAAITLIKIQRRVYTAADGEKDSEVLIHTQTSIPVWTDHRLYLSQNAVPLPFSLNSSRLANGEFYILPSEMTISQVSEIVSFSTVDLFSSVGGLLSLLLFARVVLIGRGEYVPHGWLHRVCFRQYIRRQASHDNDCSSDHAHSQLERPENLSKNKAWADKSEALLQPSNR